MQTIEEIYQRDIENFYARLIDFENISDTGEASCLCPVHQDENTSLHINIETGKWHCKTCGEGGHDAVSFYQFLYSVDKIDAKEELTAKFGLSPKPTYDLEQGYQNLKKDKRNYQYLLDRGITPEVLRKYKIGFDGKRVAIPIMDMGLNVRNVRKHLAIARDAKEEQERENMKTISAFSGTGAVRIFPIRKIRKKELYLFEGEMDTLLALSLGLDAVCLTGGAGTWKLKFNKYFQNKIVNICYDVDHAGLTGAKKIAHNLSDTAKEVYIINLPPAELPPKGDFTDYIKKFNLEAFLKLPREEFKGLEKSEADKIIEEVHLSETINPIFYNKRIRTTALITGKGDLFLIPKKVKATCKQDTGDSCAVCRLKSAAGELISKLDREDVRFLKLFKVADTEQRQVLRSLLGIPPKCKKFRLEILEAVNVEEVVLVPEINYDDVHHSFISHRSAFVVGQIQLDANRPYKFEGKVLPHPKTQKSTILIYKGEATKDDIDSFVLTNDLKEQMKIFQANSLDEMYKVLESKYEDYEAVTKIFKRRDLFMAVDLSYHSILSYNYNNRLVKRGHVNGLIYGDTRTGKSDTVDYLMTHFRAGEATGGENLSFAGLVGGVHQVLGEGRWGITWKTIPLNNRRLVKVDEFHELDDRDIHKMSEMISTGIASIQKIHAEKAAARTRLIFLANNKGGANLSEYQFGCQAITPIMGGHNEDIARLDYAVAVSSEELDLVDIDAFKRKQLKVKKFTSELSHALVMWAWAKKPSEVYISSAAEELISKIALEQTKKYHPSMPLVPPAEQGLKLSRLAVAAAAMFFSTDDECVKLFVKPMHVQFVANFLESAYTSRAMGFDHYSKILFARDRLTEPKEINALGITEAVANLLLSMPKFSASHLETIFNCDRDLGKLKIFTLLKNNAIRPQGSHMFIKTPAFIRWLAAEKFPANISSKF